jgi:hypothetical protein
MNGVEIKKGKSVKYDKGFKERYKRWVEELKELVEMSRRVSRLLGWSKKRGRYPKGFVEKMSRQLGLSKRTIYENLQAVENLSDEVKQMIRDTILADRKKILLAISRLEPEEQEWIVKRYLEEVEKGGENK